MADEKWIEINSNDQLQESLDESRQRPVVFFKHSLTCPISSRAYSEMNTHISHSTDFAAYRMIVVQHARPVSDSLAGKVGVRHESPQLIIVRDGKAVWHTSHFDITDQALHRVLDSHNQK